VPGLTWICFANSWMWIMSTMRRRINKALLSPPIDDLILHLIHQHPRTYLHPFPVVIIAKWNEAANLPDCCDARFSNQMTEIISNTISVSKKEGDKCTKSQNAYLWTNSTMIWQSEAYHYEKIKHDLLVHL